MPHEAKTAIAVPCYNRPHYLQQCLNALETAPQVQAGWPVYLFADGGPGATQDENQALFEAAAIPNKVVVSADENLGCGRHLIHIRDLVFDKWHFDRLMLIEEDTVVAHSAITVLENALTWCQQHYDNVEVVSSVIRCFISQAKKPEYAGDVFYSNTHWTNYLMTRTAWEAIRAPLHEYRRLCLMDRPYGSRDHNLCRAYMHKMTRGVSRPLGERYLPTGPIDWDPVTMFSTMNFPSGQDACTAASLFTAGLAKASLRVNRVLYIGAVGIHSRAHMFRGSGYDRVTLDVFPEDDARMEFRPALTE
jgi:hypothetical protein